MFAETVCYQEAVRQRISADLRAAEDHMVLLGRRRAIERVALFLIALAGKQRARPAAVAYSPADGTGGYRRLPWSDHRND